MEKVGLIVLSPRWLEGHETPLLLACRACQKGINIQNGVVHATRKEPGGHGLKASKDIMIELGEWIKLKAHLFLSSETFRDAPGPPLITKPLPILRVDDGLGCSWKNCDFACKQPNAMAQHWSKKHRHKKVAKKAKDAKVQTFFESHPKYFIVSPQLSGPHANSRYELYLTQLVPDLEKNCHEVVPYLASEREIPPHLKVMQWHQHLSPYLLDAETNESSSKEGQNLSLFSLPKVQSLKSIVDQPKCRHLCKALGNVVDAYLLWIKKKGQGCELRVRRMLQEYPLK